MSQAYEREQQNTSRLDELASKVSALRGVTIDIYDNARDQHVIDSTVRPSPLFSTSYTPSLNLPQYLNTPAPHSHLKNARLIFKQIVRDILLLHPNPKRLRQPPNPNGLLGE
jgi:hypothetical protein